MFLPDDPGDHFNLMFCYEGEATLKNGITMITIWGDPRAQQHHRTYVNKGHPMIYDPDKKDKDELHQLSMEEVLIMGETTPIYNAWTCLLHGGELHCALNTKNFDNILKYIVDVFQGIF